jgi:hypothetical protein
MKKKGENKETGMKELRVNSSTLRLANVPL